MEPGDLDDIGKRLRIADDRHLLKSGIGVVIPRRERALPCQRRIQPRRREIANQETGARSAGPSDEEMMMFSG